MTECNNMLETQAKCWDFLINIQNADSSFYFVPRKINNLHRLEQGYYFIGNDKYMQISFWEGGDKYEEIHNISWGADDKGLCNIEISARDDKNRAVYLAELVSILEQKTGVIYHDLKKGKWRYEYPKHIFYLDTLKSFIEKEKLIIDEYIKEHSESGISMLNKEFNDRYVLKQFNNNANSLTPLGSNKKLEGVVSVSPSSYLMTLHHNELQNAMKDYLETDSNITSVKTEVNNVDITVMTISGERIFYELKTSDVKLAIRLAIGQLLEYSEYSNKAKADKLIIVTKYNPSSNDIAYLERLRALYHMPIYYQQFDMENKMLSKLY